MLKQPAELKEGHLRTSERSSYPLLTHSAMGWALSLYREITVQGYWRDETNDENSETTLRLEGCLSKTLEPHRKKMSYRQSDRKSFVL